MVAYHKDKKITDFYKLEEELGQGAFAIVRAAVNKKTGERVAVKIIDITKMGDDEEMQLQNEIEILSQLDHPNVVKQYEIYDEKKVMYLVLELMQGGELFDRIVEKENYTEKEAADTLRPVVDAIRYCHDMNIIHRDLKPENLLYATKDETSIIKVSDFGLARYVQNELASTAVGTPGYVAPEIIVGQGYGKEVDYWSIGVILYVMLCGFPPFFADDNASLFEMIKKAEYDFPEEFWDEISEEAKDLVRKLLVVDKEKRLTAEGILQHPWMKNQGGDAKELSATQKNMKDYNAKRKWKKAGIAVIAASKIRLLAGFTKQS